MCKERVQEGWTEVRGGNAVHEEPADDPETHKAKVSEKEQARVTSAR